MENWRQRGVVVIYTVSMISMVGLGLIEDAKRSFKTIFAKK
jgi:hypothetical protein